MAIKLHSMCMYTCYGWENQKLMRMYTCWALKSNRSILCNNITVCLKKCSSKPRTTEGVGKGNEASEGYIKLVK